MTKDEFLPTLSLKAQNIINENMKNFANNRTFTVFFTNSHSKLIVKNDSDYIIYAENNIPEDMENYFLHEFFHCVQHEEGFPTLIAKDDKYKELTTFLSSIILDIDIRERLENNGYFQGRNDIKKSVDKMVELLIYIKTFNLKEEITSTIDIINTSGLIITSELTNIDNKYLVKLIKELRPKVFEYYITFCESLKLYSYKHADGIENIFKYLLKSFNLSSIIEIYKFHTCQNLLINT